MKKSRAVELSVLFTLMVSLSGCQKMEMADTVSSAKAAPGTETTSESITESVRPLAVSRWNEYESSSAESAELCYAIYTRIVLDDVHTEEFPKLALAMETYGKEKTAAAKEYYLKLLADAKHYYEITPEFPDFPLYTEIDLEVQRADSRVVSLVGADTSYAGGTHPYTYHYGVSFDSESGKRLELSDIVTDVTVIPGLVHGMVEEKYSKVPFFDNEEYFKAWENEAREKKEWTLDYHGLTFYFNPYELAPYVEGLLTVTIPFDAYKELFVERYTEIPESSELGTSGITTAAEPE